MGRAWTLLLGIALGAIGASVWFGLWRVPAAPPLEEAPWQMLPAGAQFTEVDCWFGRGWFSRERCARFHPGVGGAGGRPMLPVVAIQQRLFGRPSKRATLYLAGGPGGHSYLFDGDVAYWRQWMTRIGLDHDLVLYDQRGSFGATPFLECPALGALDREHLDSALDLDARWAEYEEVVLGCLQQVPRADRAAGVYSTLTAAQDLRELVQALKREFGYREVAVYGISYGTRLALEALADAPELVDAVVLDSPHPPGVESWLGFADAFAAILERLDAGGGRLRSTFDHALANVHADPPVLQLEDPWNGEPLSVRIDAQTLFALIEHALYADEDVDGLLALLDSVLAGDADQALLPLLAGWLVSYLDPDFGTLANLLISCRDERAITAEEEQVVLDRFPPAWREALRSASAAFTLCERAGVTPAPLSLRGLGQPTLVLAADLDPRTPADLALPLLAQLPRATLLRLPMAGHGVVDIDDCAARAAGAFLNSGGRAALPACALEALVTGASVPAARP
jgi:pimeloyl-ACP methyl ester carboxylesterase